MPVVLTIIIFSLICLIVGISISKEESSTTKELMIGRGGFTNSEIIFSWAGLKISISYMTRYIYLGVTYGLFAFINSLSNVILSATMQYILIPMFHNMYGVATLAERHYIAYKSRLFQIMIGVTQSCQMLGIITSNLLMLSMVMKDVFQIPNYMELIGFVYLITILYSLTGGLTSVVKTDTIQFLIFFFMIPCALLYLVLNYNISITSLHFSLNLTQFPDPSLHFQLAMRDLAPIFIAILVPVLDQLSFQRISSCKNLNQAQKVVLNGELLVCFLAFLFLMIGIVIREIHISQGSTTQLTDKYMMKFFYTESLSIFTEMFQYLFAIGIISIFMSTIDTLLHNAVTCIVNDIIKPIFAPTEKNTFRIMKVIFFIYGLATYSLYVFIDQYNLKIVQIVMLSLMLASIYISMFAFIFELACMGFIVSKKRILFIGMILGLSANIFGYCVTWGGMAPWGIPMLDSWNASCYEIATAILGKNTIAYTLFTSVRVIWAGFVNLFTVLILCYFFDKDFFKKKFPKESN